MLLLGLAFLAIGSGFLWFTILTLCKAKASPRWPTVAGQVFYSDVESYHTRWQRAYRAEVAYDYSVEGIKYSSKRIAFAKWGGTNQRKAEATAAQYPVGKQITVYYNPRKHYEAVIEPRSTRGIYLWMMVFGGLFFLAGLLVTIWFLHLNKS